MEERWLNLEYLPFEQTKTFVRRLFDIGIDEKMTYFSQLKDDWEPGKPQPTKRDRNMTLDNFLSLMTEEVIIRYVIGQDIYFPSQKKPAITLLLKDYHFKETSKVTRMAWYHCPYSKENYEKLDEIFQESYGIRMSECKAL
ncbi:MAG: hypothetical protein ABIF40_02795 [archaeon]